MNRVNEASVYLLNSQGSYPARTVACGSIAYLVSERKPEILRVSPAKIIILNQITPRIILRLPISGMLAQYFGVTP